jgi:hypothetical protein
MPGDIERVLARMRIGAVLRLAALLALVDAPVSCSRWIAQPRSVRIRGFSFVISIEIAAAETNPWARPLVPGGLPLVHPFRGPVEEP